jgi:GWxTD domain-containing protein
MIRSLFIVIALALALQDSFSFEAYMVNNRYYAPKIGSYVETEILIPAKELKFTKNDKGKFQAQVEITLLFFKNNNIVTYDKYLLNSIEINDSLNAKLSLIDKKRFALEPGAYTFEAIFVDINSGVEKKLSETFILDQPGDGMSISDICFVDKYAKSEENNLYTKSGYYMTPYVLNYFPENNNKLTFYAEIYNADKVVPNADIEIHYSVLKYKTTEAPNNMRRSVKVKANAVNVVFSEFNIELLPSGNYEIVVEAKNEAGELLAVKKTFFQRSKNIEDVTITAEQFQNLAIENSFVEPFSESEMRFQLRALLASANSNEQKTISSLLNGNDLRLMKQYFLNYWTSRAPLDPKGAWMEYDALIKEVNSLFQSCLGKGYGFETDRGRVYMQYGKPSQRLTRTFDPENYPHEIWHYYETNVRTQNNVRFVFLNREYGCDNYKLIHSSALGEIYNNQWATLLRKGPSTNSPDEYYDMNQARPYDNTPGSRINTMFKE